MSQHHDGGLAEIARVQLSIKPQPLTDKTLAAEIRQGLKDAKTPEERGKWIESDDPRIMAAVANAPAFLSGLDDAQLDVYTTEWSRKNFPQEADRVLRLGKALEDARRIGVSANGYFASLVKATTAPPLIVQAAARTKAAQAAATEAVAAE